MTYTMQQYEESAQAIRARLNGFVPKVAMVLGSGLGFLGDQVENPIAIDYHHIPHFKASTAPGHKGRLVCGMLDGQAVAVMQGRMHHYEGYSYEEGPTPCGCCACWAATPWWSPTPPAVSARTGTPGS